MTLDEKACKTLADLGIADAADVESLFAEARAAMDSERRELESSAPAEDAELERLARELRNRWLSRKRGIVTLIDENWLKTASTDLKPAVGRCFNEFRRYVSLEIAPWGGLGRPLGVIYVEPKVVPVPVRHEQKAAVSDLTLPGYRRPLGSIHPITQVMREIEDIFLGLGFRIETGPEVESVYYNFDALNIPESHPSRDDVDTLYVDERTLLRTHTSPVQIRSMEKYGAPLYLVAPGKVYRHDTPDASHSPMFHQIEGLAVDRDITFADLKGTLDFFARKFFGERIRTRFSPSFFPFTEPSGQVDISCAICDGQGCRTCKESGWLEVMGCGMVHPDVLRHGGIDPEQFTGWAFGLGVERFAMMKFGINDIQLFYQSDVRFLEQF
jgi:phenylalanyl-tRNA synthetase alpha chain